MVLLHSIFCAVLVVGGAGCSKTPEPPQVSRSRLDRFQAAMLEQARREVLAGPRSADAWGKLGQTFHAFDFKAEACVCYERAAALEPRAPRWPHLLGLLELQDAPESALSHLAQAAQLAGSAPDAPRLRLAQALIERGRFEEGITNLERLLANRPDHPAAALELARVHLARQQLTEAAAALSPCFTNAWTARPALLLLAQILERQGDMVRAAEAAAKAATLPPSLDWPDPFLREVQSLRLDRQKLQDRVNGLLMRQRLPEAEAALSQFLEAFPGDAEGLLLLGRLRLQQRKCGEAEEVLRRHLAAQPQSLNGLIQLGLALLCQQRWPDAVVVLRQAVALKPDFAQAHYNLGYALARIGDSRAAISSYQDALRCSPGDVESHVALAEEWARAGNRTEAMAHLERALALDPGHPGANRLRQRLRPAP
jgi:tetratricopeptide (TPR) repeat protein